MQRSPMTYRIIVPLILAVALLLSACSTDADAQPAENPPDVFADSTGVRAADAFAVVANTDVGTGPARLLIGILGPDGNRLDSPDLPILVEAAPMDDPAQIQRTPAEFAWIIEGATGLYRATFDFDRPGTWNLVVTHEGGDPLAPAPFTVRAETYSPNVGEPAPDAPTPTLRDRAFEDLTTDDDPDPRFYEMTLAEALGSGKPTVLVFSTPAYCTTATCGPILDTVKAEADAHLETNFIHIEVYTGFNEPGFAPDPGHLAPAAGPGYWNLPSEPWVFVIDERGIVTARFEGAMTGAELASALG